MSAESTFTGLPGWAQGVLAVGALGLIVIIGFTIYKKIQKRIGLAGAFKEKREVTDKLKELEKENIKPTLSDAEFAAMANQLVAAFDGYGSKVSEVYKNFDKLKNDADVLKLIDAYGIREISSGRFNPEPNYKGTLAGAIAEEMAGQEIAYANSVLKKKGIKITF